MSKNINNNLEIHYIYNKVCLINMLRFMFFIKKFSNCPYIMQYKHNATISLHDKKAKRYLIFDFSSVGPPPVI